VDLCVNRSVKLLTSPVLKRATLQTEDDESKRNEKIQRASFEIKNNAIATGTPVACAKLQQHTQASTALPAAATSRA